jgi:topoisomerase-4 subunit A
VVEDDLVRLTEIKIKRISKFDSLKADELITKIEGDLDEVKNNLSHLTEYTIRYFEQLLKNHGDGRERRTVISQFDTIKARRVAAANVKLYMNRKDGFVGTSLRKDEYVCDCSDLDNVIVFRKDGKFVITPVGDKMFVGKEIIHAAVWKKNDKHMVYNAIYRDGGSGICYGKRFSVTSIVRDREYDVTQGNEKSEIIYFTANPNSESEMVTVNLHSSVKARKKIFDYDFSELAIKGRAVKGNIISKYRIRKVVQKEVGDSTLGGRDIWLDENIGRLNTDKQGRYLGSFNTGESILVIYEEGSYELTDFELTNRYKLNEIEMIEKFNIEKIITVVHFDGGSRNYYVKRFQVETTTTGKRFNFISENRGSKLVVISTDERPLLEFSYRTKRGDKKSKKENLVEFVEMKGWKAMGNKLGNYLRMSGFKWLRENEEKSEILEERDNTELTLFN